MTYDRIERMPDDVVIVHHPNFPRPAPRGQQGVAEIPLDRLIQVLPNGQETCRDFHSYDTSTPTGPRDGFVYLRRHWEWKNGHPSGLASGTDDRRVFLDEWTLYVVKKAPADDPEGGLLHHPHEVLVLL